MTTQSPLRTGFHAQQRFYSDDVKKVKAWFEDAVSQIKGQDVPIVDNALLGKLGAQTFVYIGEENSAQASTTVHGHALFEAQVKKDFMFGNLLAVLDPEIAFDDQWPNDRDNDCLVNLAIGAVKSQQVQDFLKPPQKPSVLVAAVKKLAHTIRL